MYPSASTPTIKSGFMLWVKQSANCLPVSIHSISSPAGWWRNGLNLWYCQGHTCGCPCAFGILDLCKLSTHTYTNYLFTRHGAVHLHTHTRNKRKLYRDDLCHSPFWDGFARHSFFLLLWAQGIKVFRYDGRTHGRICSFVTCRWHVRPEQVSTRTGILLIQCVAIRDLRDPQLSFDSCMQSATDVRLRDPQLSYDSCLQSATDVRVNGWWSWMRPASWMRLSKLWRQEHRVARQWRMCK
jgi:hypothetical protein